MLIFDAWAFPDGEVQIPHWMTQFDKRVEGRLTYQYDKYSITKGFCRQQRRAIDAGAHVGLWSYWMAKDFTRVDAFEPVEAHRICWYVNLVDYPDAQVHPYALGAHFDHVRMVSEPGQSGGAYVELADGGIEQHPLDSFGFSDVDLLKIDCEGYEPAVILGAVETIRRCRPVVIVEQSPKGRQTQYGFEPTQAVDMLVAFGGELVVALGMDTVIRFPEV